MMQKKKLACLMYILPCLMSCGTEELSVSENLDTQKVDYQSTRAPQLSSGKTLGDKSTFTFIAHYKDNIEPSVSEGIDKEPVYARYSAYGTYYYNQADQRMYPCTVDGNYNYLAFDPNEGQKLTTAINATETPYYISVVHPALSTTAVDVPDPTDASKKTTSKRIRYTLTDEYYASDPFFMNLISKENAFRVYPIPDQLALKDIRAKITPLFYKEDIDYTLNTVIIQNRGDIGYYNVKLQESYIEYTDNLPKTLPMEQVSTFEANGIYYQPQAGEEVFIFPRNYILESTSVKRVIITANISYSTGIGKTISIPLSYKIGPSQNYIISFVVRKIDILVNITPLAAWDSSSPSLDVILNNPKTVTLGKFMLEKDTWEEGFDNISTPEEL